MYTNVQSAGKHHRAQHNWPATGSTRQQRQRIVKYDTRKDTENRINGSFRFCAVRQLETAWHMAWRRLRISAGIDTSPRPPRPHPPCAQSASVCVSVLIRNILQIFSHRHGTHTRFVGVGALGGEHNVAVCVARIVGTHFACRCGQPPHLSQVENRIQ